MKTTVNLMSLLVISVIFTKCETFQSTTKKVPLYIRQSWLSVSRPFLSECICESGVEASLAFRSIINSEVSSSACLRSFYKCLTTRTNFLDATKGEFIKEEILRQAEGVTSEIYEKCLKLVADEVDVATKVFNMYVCIVDCLAKPSSNYQHEPAE